MEPLSQPITTVVGKEVYSNNGVFVGVVNDVQLDFEKEEATALAVTNQNTDLFEQDSPGVLVPYRWVQAVDNIVIVSDAVERAEPDGGPSH